jgi:hypothetical protein
MEGKIPSAFTVRTKRWLLRIDNQGRGTDMSLLSPSRTSASQLVSGDQFDGFVGKVREYLQDSDDGHYIGDAVELVEDIFRQARLAVSYDVVNELAARLARATQGSGSRRSWLGKRGLTGSMQYGRGGVTIDISVVGGRP